MGEMTGYDGCRRFKALQSGLAGGQKGGEQQYETASFHNTKITKSPANARFPSLENNKLNGGTRDNSQKNRFFVRRRHYHHE
jgi:hypothetical protein